MIELKLNPDARALRTFGGAALVAFGALGAAARWRGALLGIGLGEAADTVSLLLWGLAALCGVLALAAPRALLPLYVALSLITYPIGLVLSFVLLLVLFALVITPMGLVFRLLGKDPLQRRFDRDASSYWVPYRRRGGAERYFRQF